MVVVFTGGDDLSSNQSLDAYLGRNCPQALKDILEMCGNRCVLFDNHTSDDMKKSAQIEQLFSFVEEVVAKNGGKSYTNELFLELQAPFELDEQTAEKLSKEEYSNRQIYHFQEQHKRLADMVDSKLNSINLKLEAQLAEERAARIEALMMAQAVQLKSDEEMRQMRESLEKAQREAEELRKETADQKRPQAAQSESDEKMRQIRESLKKAQREAEELRNETAHLRRRADDKGCTIL